MNAGLSGASIGWASVNAVRRQRQASRQADLDAGKTVFIPAVLRLLDRRWPARRWRNGLVVTDGVQLIFRLRLPKFGRRFDLSDVRFVGTRPKRRWESLWFFGPTVMVLEGPFGRFELVPQFGEDVAIIESLLRDRSG